MLRSARSLGGKFSQTPLCPDCDQTIEADDINLEEGFALCPGCGVLTRMSELNHSGRSSADYLGRPPAGCTIDTSGRAVRVKASLHSIGGFLAATGVAIFWNGITSVFLLTAIAGLYANLVGPVPEWFPAPGIEGGKPIMNDKPMNLGMTLFMCLFLTPFVVIGAGMVIGAVLCLIGRVEVFIDGVHSYVATGAGPLVWWKRFDAEGVHRVGLVETRSQSNDANNRALELSGDKSVRFGSQLTEERQGWLLFALREVLLKPRSEWRDRLLAGRGMPPRRRRD